MPISDPWGNNRGYSMLWFVYLYILSAYVKRYRFSLKILREYSWRLFFGSALLLSGVSEISNVPKAVHPIFEQYNIGFLI